MMLALLGSGRVGIVAVAEMNRKIASARMKSAAAPPTTIASIETKIVGYTGVG
jgi:hypothetical protein